MNSFMKQDYILGYQLVLMNLITRYGYGIVIRVNKKFCDIFQSESKITILTVIVL
ncbi:hypothetical protein SAMN05661012_00948 [Chitinophaga sancti]|uniref:Uncharacterized protein n=1 Tax=Chitinophaga sancti TaxID=1004 RepID=A0A1K1MW54_9BACT|nr:hypothetical protein SAMN05661012_00948 [Chitinophaga sancti]